MISLCDLSTPSVRTRLHALPGPQLEFGSTLMGCVSVERLRLAGPGAMELLITNVERVLEPLVLDATGAGRSLLARPPACDVCVPFYKITLHD